MILPDNGFENVELQPVKETLPCAKCGSPPTKKRPKDFGKVILGAQIGGGNLTFLCVRCWAFFLRDMEHLIQLVHDSFKTKGKTKKLIDPFAY